MTNLWQALRAKETRAATLEREAHAHEIRAHKFGHWTTRQVKQAEKKRKQAEKLRKAS